MANTWFKDLLGGYITVRTQETKAERDIKIAQAKENAAAAASIRAGLPAGGSYPAQPPANNVPGMPIQIVPVSNPAPGAGSGAPGTGALSTGWLVGLAVLFFGVLAFGILARK